MSNPGGNSFEESYRASLARHAPLDFIRVYSLRGECTAAKTFAEFDRDVRAAMAYMAPRAAAVRQIVTIDGNTYEHATALCAAWRLGVPVCPVNPAETEDRIKSKLAKLGGKSLVLRSPQMQAALQEPPAKEGRVCGGNHVSTLIFTSGSTGYAKIVEQRETAILANTAAVIEAHQLAPGKVVATPLPIFHVNALHFSLAGTLLSGARLVLMEGFALPQAWQILQDEGVHIFSVVPLILKHMLADADTAGGYNLESWRYAVSAAAALPPELARSFYARFKRKIIQGYGLSEAVNFSCLIPPAISETDYECLFLNARFPTIGQALPCNEVGLLDASGNTVGEPGREGEIALRGPCVMHGYRGEAATPAFGGFMRTGDLGYFQEGPGGEKYYFISGRLKDVVKRAGMTVSLREIDDVMSGFPGAECIAIPFDNDHTGEEIGLAVQAGESVAGECLKEFVRERLPAYMRPVIALQVDGPVRSPGGKPVRWQFQPLFAEFAGRQVGRSLLLLDRRGVRN